MYDSRDDCNAIIGKRDNILIAGCKNSTIPDGVTGIWQEAFRGHTGLTSIYIPNSVVSIGQEAFYNCSGLVFVAIGNSVKNIGNSAFAGCNNVRDVYCFAESIPTTGETVFRSANSATLHVPAASLEAYRETSPWSKFKNIVPLTDEELTKVERLSHSQTEGESVIYDLSGRRLTKIQHGINIVRNPDGSLRKVMVK
ncbi:MAG: leucine-rich repeat domain-containing protein [Bacteroidaceae bacterium]|nr:leucine-rich repeat domain-containing protein [Bacteroidaceae bacterium]